ncbi:hypothetical protein HDU93_000459 [Gonapodya sp. JEL0774]|nr:hypothetical protein HDU93_000459 [Gonapodya sp. JEL0774]
MGKSQKRKARKPSGPSSTPRRSRRGTAHVLGSSSDTVDPLPASGSDDMRAAIVRAAEVRKQQEKVEREKQNKRKTETMLANKAAVLERAKTAVQLLEKDIATNSARKGTGKTRMATSDPGSPTSSREITPSSEEATSRRVSELKGVSNSPRKVVTQKTPISPNHRITPPLSQLLSSSFKSSLYTYDPDPNPAIEPSPVPYFASGRAG